MFFKTFFSGVEADKEKHNIQETKLDSINILLIYLVNHWCQIGHMIIYLWAWKLHISKAFCICVINVQRY